MIQDLSELKSLIYYAVFYSAKLFLLVVVNIMSILICEGLLMLRQLSGVNFLFLYSTYKFDHDKDLGPDVLFKTLSGVICVVAAFITILLANSNFFLKNTKIRIWKKEILIIRNCHYELNSFHNCKIFV